VQFLPKEKEKNSMQKNWWNVVERAANFHSHSKKIVIESTSEHIRMKAIPNETLKIEAKILFFILCPFPQTELKGL